MIKNESHISYGDEIPLNKTHHSFLNGAFFMNKIKQRSLLTIPICNANTEGQHLAFFLHIVSSMWVNIFCELVEHEDYDESEVNRALEQYAAYSMAGWRELMKP